MCHSPSRAHPPPERGVVQLSECHSVVDWDPFYSQLTTLTRREGEGEGKREGGGGREEGREGGRIGGRRRKGAWEGREGGKKRTR